MDRSPKPIKVITSNYTVTDEGYAIISNHISVDRPIQILLPSAINRKGRILILQIVI